MCTKAIVVVRVVSLVPLRFYAVECYFEGFDRAAPLLHFCRPCETQDLRSEKKSCFGPAVDCDYRMPIGGQAPVCCNCVGAFPRYSMPPSKTILISLTTDKTVYVCNEPKNTQKLVQLLGIPIPQKTKKTSHIIKRANEKFEMSPLSRI